MSIYALLKYMVLAEVLPWIIVGLLAAVIGVVIWRCWR